METAICQDAAAGAASLDVMNFLNEIAGEFPQAIAFSSGRPTERFFDLDHWLQEIPGFLRHFAAQQGVSSDAASKLLLQYGRTNGIINDLIARQVGCDHAIVCAASQVLVTAGCQEAIDLCVKTLCSGPDDVLLVRSPTYIGITGAATLNGVHIVPLSCDRDEHLLETMRQTVDALAARAKRVRVLYLVPDFDNPTGATLSRATREAIIALCAEQGILILEDNPYGMFRFEGEAVLPMYALDTFGCVIFLGTYSKTLCPALRVGFAIVPEVLPALPMGGAGLLNALSQAKSFSTVNTSQLAQAVVGGILLAQDCSLAAMSGAAVALYRQNRDRMLACLQSGFAGYEQVIGWNAPEGGFFLTVTLPFDFLLADAQQCARDYGVVVMPLSFFSLTRAQDRSVRLAFSNVDGPQIALGIARFSDFVKDRLKGAAHAADAPIDPA